jgi:hypothetical protein
MDYYLYLNSEDSNDTHPENAQTDFTVELTRPITLDGVWECGLIDVASSSTSGVVYVCSDVCEESFTCDTPYPILRMINYGAQKRSVTSNFVDLRYIRVNKGHLQRI